MSLVQTAATRDGSADVSRGARAEETRAPTPRRRRPLRILVAHNVPRARNGGMSRLMGFIHDRVSDAGHAVEHLCSDDVYPQGGGKWARFGFPLAVLRHARLAARRGEAYDLINVHEPSSAAVALFKGLAGNPVVVVTSYGVERRSWELALAESRLGREGPSWKTRFAHPLTSLWQSGVGLRYATHVICSNSDDRDYLVENLRAAPDRITRMHSAADVVFAESSRGRSYARCERILFAATWRKNKGVEDFVPAFTEAAARHPRLKLTVLGGGVPPETVYGAFPPHLRTRITCVNAKTDVETAAEFAKADLFVLPSLFEGTPLTLIEAMMSGLPVITTATCGMKDVIRNDENGVLIPMRSPQAIVEMLEQLIADEQLRARLGGAAKAEAAEKYTWDSVAKPILEVYERLCEERRGG